jgi:putative heme iron utilization protein
MIDWILENWVNIAAAWGMLVALCSIIVKATPTQKDDNILAKIVKWADVFSVVFTKEDAETIAKALKKKAK